MESVSSLFGRITALRRGDLSPKDDEKRLDAQVRVVMHIMKQRLASLTEGPLQVSGPLNYIALNYIAYKRRICGYLIECGWDCRVRQTFTVRCSTVAVDVEAGRNTALGIGATMLKRAVSWTV